jgi:hypothetical protein
VVADFQIGMWLDNSATVRRVVSRLAERRPALVLILGDFVYKGGDELEVGGRLGTLRDLLRPLSGSDIQTFAVLGNHDYGMSASNAEKDVRRAERVEALLQELGLQTLKNEAVALSLPGTDQATESVFYLVGIGAHIPKEDRPLVALAQLPADAPRLVMMHNPSSFDALPAGTAPLAIAAHTHGGQFRIPLTPSWSWLTFLREDKVHVDGWIQDYGAPGNRLYVNRGIGFSLLPMRLNAPPEVTLFTLEPG